MIIDRIEPIALRVPFQSRTPAETGAADALYLVMCRVSTRDGPVGYGECLCLRRPHQGPLVATIRDVIAPLYLGKSVADREALNLETRRRLASFGRAGTNLNALAAVDIALWDIAAKAAGQPLHALLGGARRSRVPVMASLDRYNDAARVRDRIEAALAASAAAIKVHEFDLDVIEAGRATAGSTIPFVADCNNAHTLTDVRNSLSRWQALDLLWLEDPVWPPEDLLETRALPRIRVGLGADLGSAEQMLVWAKAPAVAVVQPDICMLGGVSEARRVLDVLAAYDVGLAPHTPFVGPAALASLHVLAVTDRNGYFATVEAEAHMDMYGIGLPAWQPDLAVPAGVGLGHDPDPGWLRQHTIDA